MIKLENKKLKVDKLSLEVTRRCDLKCRHCFRGDAQNVDMNPNIIDTVFSQISEIGELIFTGGEPFIALKQIIIAFYIANIYGVKINSWQIVTNGTIVNKTTLEALFNYLNQNFPHCKGLIAISYDKYHMNEINRLKIDASTKWEVLKSMCKKYNIKFELNEIKRIFSIGRAENLPECVSTTYLLLENNFIKDYDGLNNTLNACLEISAKGDVIRPNCTYEKADMTAYGNVLQRSLQDIIYDIIDMQTMDQINNRFTDSNRNSKASFNI